MRKRRIQVQWNLRYGVASMNIRQRKLAGTIATVLFLAVYSLVAMAVGGAFVVGANPIGEFVFFVIAGAGWLPVIMAIVKWMSRPDSPG